MRNRIFSSTAVAAGLALVLTSCTSEDATVAGRTTDDAAVATDDGLEGEPGRGGWLCEHVSPAAVEAASGGEPVNPRQLVLQDDAEGWVCEVLTGEKGAQEPVVRLSILLGDEARATARERAEAAEGVEPGPEYLGRSYISDGLVTGLTTCTRPGATKRDDRVPHTIVAESLGEKDEATTKGLLAAAGQAAQGLDRGLGCSPKQAVIEQSEDAQGEGDDAATTTAP